MKRGIVIAISGFHGVGKSTIAKYLSSKFRLKYVSSGELFRKIADELNVSLTQLSKIAEEDPSIDYRIDSKMKEEAEKGGVVGDALLAGWILKDIADLKIWLKAPLEIRVRRIAEREGREYNEVYKETLERELSEKRRFKKYYSINLDDLSIYDFVISTHLMDLNTLIEVIESIVEAFIKLKGDDFE